MKPFNLQDYLKNPDQPIVTCYDEVAKVVFTQGLGKRPILAVIWDGNTTDSAWYSVDGKDFAGRQGLYFVQD